MTTLEINEVDLNVTQTEEKTVAAWHAIFTRPRHEKAVDRQLEERRIESFLPLYGKFHRWKDRKKLVLLPIFPAYVFVRILRSERLAVLQLSGVLRFITFGGSPAEIPDAELRALRASIDSGTSLEPHRYMTVGRRVKVCRGPLQDTEGILIRKKGGHRLVLSINSIQRSLAVEVDVADVSPILEPARSSRQGIQRSLTASSNLISPGSHS
jgi:transcription antitermination factor NusG